jgi:hypothetical protein
MNTIPAERSTREFWLAHVKAWRASGLKKQTATACVFDLPDSSRNFCCKAVDSQTRLRGQEIRLWPDHMDIRCYDAVAVHHDLILSMAHIRWAQNEAGKIVLDGEPVVVTLVDDSISPEVFSAFLRALSITRQPRANLKILYQGWLDTLTACQAAQITGVFAQSETEKQAAIHRIALQDCQRLEAETARLRSLAAKEKQLARRVGMNIELQRLQKELENATRQLSHTT